MNVHCGWCSGENSGFDIDAVDKAFMETCRVVILTCTFGGGDDLYQPIGYTNATAAKVSVLSFCHIGTHLLMLLLFYWCSLTLSLNCRMSPRPPRPIWRPLCESFQHLWFMGVHIIAHTLNPKPVATKVHSWSNKYLAPMYSCTTNVWILLKAVHQA